MLPAHLVSSWSFAGAVTAANGTGDVAVRVSAGTAAASTPAVRGSTGARGVTDAAAGA